MNKKFFPGEKICEKDGFIRGHGTFLNESTITSTYHGKIEITDKLITINPFFNFKYVPEIGDVVIGRVKDIFNKKWVISLNSNFDCFISLGAIDLPGLVQRRKIDSDEMDMRKIFDVDDLILCEVQKINKNGNVALHTKSFKFNKLTDGFLLKIPAMFLKSQKSHFIKNKDLSVVVGKNGYIWISSEKNIRNGIKLRNFILNEIKKNIKIDIKQIISDEIFLKQ